MDYPSRINLGSGKDYRQGWLNIDIDPRWKPDVVCDISQTPFDLPLGYFDEIVANDVLEHIPDLVAAMRNILDLLKPGGTFTAYVPYDLSYGAWCDPTHVRAFNERSFLYYTDWHWYLQWHDARFDMENLDFALSPLGKEMRDHGTSDAIILRTPRAVDGMRVVLVKRLLQEQSEDSRIGEAVKIS